MSYILQEFIFEDGELVATSNAYTHITSLSPVLVTNNKIVIIPTFSIAQMNDLFYVVSRDQSDIGTIIENPTEDHLSEHIRACISSQDDCKFVAICRLKSDRGIVGVSASNAEFRRASKDELYLIKQA